MNVIIILIASVLLLMCVSTSPTVERRATQEISVAEEHFVNSLGPEQLEWWAEKRQKLFDSVVTTAIGDSGEPNENDETAEEIKDFIKSLNPTQQGLWSKLRNKATRIVTKFVASHGTHPAIERSGRGRCGGGCVLSIQCQIWAGGNGDCRCTWFTCG